MYCVTAVRTLLLQHNAAYRETVAPQFCEVHPVNRNGEMLIPIAVWELLVIVATLEGFDPSQLQNALCTEISTDNADTDAILGPPSPRPGDPPPGE